MVLIGVLVITKKRNNNANDFNENNGCKNNNKNNDSRCNGFIKATLIILIMKTFLMK